MILVLRQQLFALLDRNSWWSTRQQLVALHDRQSVDARDFTRPLIIQRRRGLQQAGEDLEVLPACGNRRLKRWCSISIQGARSKDLATEVADKNDSRASGRWLPWSSRERQWATSLMDSWIFSVRSRSCSNDRWSCRTIASKADLEKEESCHQQ